jgi:hypothetical protein
LRKEFDALGIEWDRRGARNDEYIAAMRVVWAGTRAEFHGAFVDFQPVTCSPRRCRRQYRSSSAATLLRHCAEQLREFGVGRVMVPAFSFAGPGGVDRLSEFAERVIPAVGPR